MAEYQKKECPKCGKMVAPYVPRGGDGSACRLRSHKDKEGKKCDGRFCLLDA